jgi:hypothetical protein
MRNVIRAKRRNGWFGLMRDRRGMMAVEFALVGPPFLLLLLAVIELGLTLLTQSVLDGSARDAARLIRTGQVQANVDPIGFFQSRLCADMSVVPFLSDCGSKALFAVQQFANFGSVAFTPCTKNANSNASGGTACTFNPGQAGQVIGVRVSYPRTYLIPWVGACLTGGQCWMGIGSGPTSGGSGVTTLMSTVVFQNEPFQ